MKEIILASILLISSQIVQAKTLELTECQRVGYTTCSINSDCHATVYANGGMCIKLVDFIKGEKYSCEKSGVVAIDKIDFESANAAGLTITQNDYFHFDADATQLINESALMTFGVYNSYDTPEKFTVTCKVMS